MFVCNIVWYFDVFGIFYYFDFLKNHFPRPVVGNSAARLCAGLRDGRWTRGQRTNGSRESRPLRSSLSGGSCAGSNFVAQTITHYPRYLIDCF